MSSIRKRSVYEQVDEQGNNINNSTSNIGGNTNIRRAKMHKIGDPSISGIANISNTVNTFTNIPASSSSSSSSSSSLLAQQGSNGLNQNPTSEGFQKQQQHYQQHLQNLLLKQQWQIEHMQKIQMRQQQQLGEFKYF